VRQVFKWAGIVAAVLVLIAGMAFAVRGLLKVEAPKKKQVQQISLVKPQMPPKPPPEPEKVEQPKIKEDLAVPKEEPKPEDNSPPPDAPLGLDAAATAGSDAFGLAARPGGRDITTIGETTGKGTGPGRGGMGTYSSHLQSLVQERLNREERLRKAEYRSTVELWIEPDGRVGRVEIAGTTGNPDTDDLLRKSIAGARLNAPPENLPQPVKVRVTSRFAG